MSGLRVGLIGLSGDGQAVLAALAGLEGVELSAVADRDATLAEQTARPLGAQAYDDYRSLIVESPLDVLLAADPPFATSEYLELAAQRGMHAWRTAPWERSFEGAVRLVRAFERAGRQLAVGSPWRQVPGAPEAAGRRELRNACLAQATSRLAWAGALGWRGDRRRAGGGALLQLAYPWMDWVTHLLGLPEAVMAALGSAGSWVTAGAHDTEDTAGVVLRYGGRRVGSVTATWSAGPAEQRLLMFAGGGVWEFTLGGVRRDRAQDPVSQEVMAQPAEHCPPQAWQADLGGFLRAVAEHRPVSSSGAEHLAVMAMMEAAYLSARTGQPEQPARFYQLHNLAMPSGAGQGGASARPAGGGVEKPPGPGSY